MSASSSLYDSLLVHVTRIQEIILVRQTLVPNTKEATSLINRINSAVEENLGVLSNTLSTPKPLPDQLTTLTGHVGFLQEVEQMGSSAGCLEQAHRLRKEARLLNQAADELLSLEHALKEIVKTLEEVARLKRENLSAFNA